MKKFWERLQVCWYVLTMRNYFFAGYKSDRNMLIENEEGDIIGIRKNTIHCFYHIDNVLFEGDIKTLRELICDNIIRVVNKIKSYEL